MWGMRRLGFAAVLVVLAALAADRIASARNLGTGVAAANVRVGSTDNEIASGVRLRVLADGGDPLENPSGVITHFGHLNDFPPQTIEATKTEPDENTYLVLDRNPGGPVPGYDYGRHFLFQGHENGNDLAYVTRINLDVKAPHHRVTLLTPVGADGKTHLNRIDGSVWNPFTRTLLFTQEDSAVGGVIEIPATWGTPARTLYGSMGRAAYEGIHPDDEGNLHLAEDTGGSSVLVNPADPTSPKNARLPNSFIYRFVPTDPADLTAGKLQALQVTIDSQPLKFVPIDALHPTGDVFSDAQLKLHTLGTSWSVKWVTVHDTAVDGTANFDANAAAKAAGATPFKRPENLQFRPGSGFRTFFFVATGDTSANSGNQPALAQRGAWGTIFRVDLASDRNTGTISVFFLGDSTHSSFDNLAFADADTLLVTEDRGDTLHKQLNALDSIWAFDVDHPGSAKRLVALGRDAASFPDSQRLDAATPGFQNDGDNEPTGLHVSNGDPSVRGLLGRRSQPGARWFFTQQHGLNRVFEILGANKSLEEE